MGRVLLEEGVVSERWPHFLIDTVAMEICIFCKLTLVIGSVALGCVWGAVRAECIAEVQPVFRSLSSSSQIPMSQSLTACLPHCLCSSVCV